MGRIVEPVGETQNGTRSGAAVRTGATLLDHTYSNEFNDALRASSSRVAASASGQTLHGNGPASRMARFESSTLGELKHHTGPLDGKRVLDFGCGTGTITPSLAMRATDVVAFDISSEAVDITAARLAEHGLDGGRSPSRTRTARSPSELGAFDSS